MCSRSRTVLPPHSTCCGPRELALSGLRDRLAQVRKRFVLGSGQAESFEDEIAAFVRLRQARPQRLERLRIAEDRARQRRPAAEAQQRSESGGTPRYFGSYGSAFHDFLYVSSLSVPSRIISSATIDSRVPAAPPRTEIAQTCIPPSTGFMSMPVNANGASRDSFRL